MIIKGKREIKKVFDPEVEFKKILELDDIKTLNIDMGNRVFMYIIVNKDDDVIVDIFNRLKIFNNETTFSLMIRYYVNKNINSAIDLLYEMKKKNIQIKKRTVMPIINKFCELKEIINLYKFYKEWIKKKIKLINQDYECILPLILRHKNIKILKSFLKSMKRNLTTVNTKIVDIFLKNNKDNSLKIEQCNVNNQGICNNVKLKSLDLTKDESKMLMKNIEIIYAEEKNKNNLDEYIKFLNKNKNIDVLLDGANILFNTDRKITINGYHRINSIYQKLKNNNYTPLIILHQRHFDFLNKSGLSKKEIKEVQNIYLAWGKNIYLTPYKMNDDWFFIYGSIYDNKIKVVTNDQLRDHIFKISEQDLYQDVLKKWIERRIINYKFKFKDYNNLSSLKLIFPNKFSTRVQKINDIWYLPENKNRWITIKIN